MMKYLEFHLADSCWNRADHNEIIFVLLARDGAAQVAIQAWCEERIRLGKNAPGDPQILEALECSSRMAEQRKRSLAACRHLRLNEDGVCRDCGADCRGGQNA